MAAGSRDDRAVAAMAGGAPVRRRGRGQKGALAWAYLGPNPAYREAWAAHAVPPAFEGAPIPMHLQAEAELEAQAFGLLAGRTRKGMRGAVGRVGRRYAADMERERSRAAARTGSEAGPGRDGILRDAASVADRNDGNENRERSGRSAG